MNTASTRSRASTPTGTPVELQVPGAPVITRVDNEFIPRTPLRENYDFMEDIRAHQPTWFLPPINLQPDQHHQHGSDRSRRDGRSN